MKCKPSKVMAVLASAILALAVVPTVFAASALAEDLAIEVQEEPQIELEVPEADGIVGVIVQEDAEACPKGGEHKWEQKIEKATFGKDGCFYGVCSKCGLDGRDTGNVAPIVPITEVKLSKTSYTYTGKACKPKVTVSTYDGPLATDQYKVTYSNNINAGSKTAVATVKLTSDYYKGTKKLKFTIKKAANTLVVKGRTATVSYVQVKKADQTLKRTKVIGVGKAQGTVTYAKKSGNSYITIGKKSGKVTVKKGLKKGTYKVKVAVTAAGDTNYKKATQTVTFKVVVQ